MALFPQLKSGTSYVLGDDGNNPIAKYPFRATNSWLTRTVRFLDDSEQSWTVHPPLFSTVIQYQSVNGYDLALVRNFFAQYKGRLVGADLQDTFEMEVNGVTYPNLVFDQDELDVGVNSSESFDFVLRIRQVKTSFVGGGPDLSGGPGITVTYSVTFDLVYNTDYASWADGYFSGGRFIFEQGPLTNVTRSVTVDAPSGQVGGNSLRIGLFGSLLPTDTGGNALFGTGDSLIRVREVKGTVNYPDGSTIVVRPRGGSYTPGGDGGSASNIPLAYDSDNSTYAVVESVYFGPLLSYGYLTFIF